MDLGRRRRERKRAASESEIVLGYPDGTSLRARLVDSSEGGAGIACARAPGEGARVTAGGRRARVCWEAQLADRSWRAGLSFEDAARPSAVEPEEDCYETLQLSPNADSETIQRVFRILAQRYHPDNQQTGNEEAFKRVLAAYRVLNDPEQRAAFDARRAASQEARWWIFDRYEATQGLEAEKRKRHGILGVLHARRMADPSQPFLTIRELEQLLGCPKEHLEFSLWYLKETGAVARSDNGRYAITARGVDQAEAEGWRAPERRMLEDGNPRA